MCISHALHPITPCCGTAGFCQRWPRIDWNKATWKVKQPRALWAEVRYAKYRYGGSPVVVIDDPPLPVIYAYSATFPAYTAEPSAGDTAIRDVLFSLHAYHMRAGEFVARYNQNCQWSARCRERLCPAFFGLMIVEKPDIGWSVTARMFTPNVHDFDAYRSAASELEDPITGAFHMWTDLAADSYYGQSLTWLSWRDILRAAECVFLPSIAARGFPVSPDEQIEQGLLYRLERADGLIHSPPALSSFYRPTAMDLAVEWTLSAGLTFGIESDPDSPMYGQFVIYDGGIHRIIETAQITVVDTTYNATRQGFYFRIEIGSQTAIRLVNLPFVSEDETPETFAARVAAEIAIAVSGLSPDDLVATVVVSGTTVTVTSITTSTSIGGYPMSFDVDDVPPGELGGKFQTQNARKLSAISTPWQLVDRDEVVAEWGEVNRFERTDDNDTLPAWVELELIRI